MQRIAKKVALLWVLGVLAAAHSGFAAGSFRGLGGEAAGAISGDGSTVVGFDVDPAGSRFAWRWTAAEGRTDLPHLNADTTRSQVLGVSLDGSVISGTSIRDVRDTPFEAIAFRWTAAGGTQRD